MKGKKNSTSYHSVEQSKISVVITNKLKGQGEEYVHIHDQVLNPWMDQIDPTYHTSGPGSGAVRTATASYAVVVSDPFNRP